MIFCDFSSSLVVVMKDMVLVMLGNWEDWDGSFLVLVDSVVKYFIFKCFYMLVINLNCYKILYWLMIWG